MSKEKQMVVARVATDSNAANASRILAVAL